MKKAVDTTIEFKCQNCGQIIPVSPLSGTKNRNHCPFCLYSLHVDQKVAGDRAAKCHGLMQPIGLSFKHPSKNKYAPEKEVGELLLIHQCTRCNKIILNRLAADDDNAQIEKIFKDSQKLSAKNLDHLKKANIYLAQKTDWPQIQKQIWGKS